MSFPTLIERIVFITFENHSYSSVINNGPYFKFLATTYGRVINDNEVCNPSLPNYFATTCGSTENKCGTDSVSIVDTKNIFSLCDSSGLKWDAYAEGWNGSCSSPGGTKFAVRHCPEFFYKNTVQNPTPGYCQAHFHTLTDWLNLINSGGTPSNFVYITPDLCNDAHDCSVQTADNWLKNVLNLPNLLTKPWAQKTVFIIWWDEGYGSGRYVVFVSPISKGTSFTSNAKDGDYQLLTTMEWLLGLGTCGNNDNPTIYPPMKELFQTGPLPLSVSLKINPSTIIIGQQVTFTAIASGGTPPYTYSWIRLPTPCTGSNVSTITCDPNTAGTYNISVTVKDTTNNTMTASGTLTVNKPGPTPLTASLTINPNKITIGQQTTFTITASGGTPPYIYSWTGLPTPCTGSNVNTITCSPNTAGTFNIGATVKDAVGDIVTAKGSLTVSPQPPPTEKKFNIFDVILADTTNERAILAMQNDSGKYTKSEACTQICTRLGKIPGTQKYSIFDANTTGTTTLRGILTFQRDTGQYTIQEACTKICELLGTI